MGPGQFHPPGESVLWQGENAIRDLSFTPDGSRLLAFTYGQAGPSAVTLDLGQGSAIRSHATSGANLNTGAARLSSDGKRLFLSHKNGSSQQLTVNCLDPATGRTLWSTDLGKDYGVSSLAISPDDKVLVTATGFAEDTIRVWDAETGRPVTELKGHTAWVGGGNVLPGRLLARLGSGGPDHSPVGNLALEGDENTVTGSLLLVGRTSR